jgi:ABC-type transporter Mla maintaining outer membrane lipid asymmetry ATPase subunit MlaF
MKPPKDSTGELASSAEVVLEMVDAAIASLQTPELVVLEDVQWLVRKHDYWIIGGPPGSGKGDLLATAAGLLRPTRGRHLLFGEDVALRREEERVRTQLRVGVVFGYGGRLFSQLTVAENLALPLCYHHNCDASDSEERVRLMLRTLELEHMADSAPARLDRNAQQRAALARALMLSPELLVLDNPLVGTSLRELNWWLGFLDDLRKGHPILEGTIPTLIVGSNDLLHWGERGRQFAFIEGRRFVPVGNREAMAAKNDPALRELLPADWFDK